MYLLELVREALRELPVVAPNQCHAFLAGDVAVTDFLGGLVSTAADAELDVTAPVAKCLGHSITHTS